MKASFHVINIWPNERWRLQMIDLDKAAMFVFSILFTLHRYYIMANVLQCAILFLNGTLWIVDTV